MVTAKSLKDDSLVIYNDMNKLMSRQEVLESGDITYAYNATNKESTVFTLNNLKALLLHKNIILSYFSPSELARED